MLTLVHRICLFLPLLTRRVIAEFSCNMCVDGSLPENRTFKAPDGFFAQATDQSCLSYSNPTTFSQDLLGDETCNYYHILGYFFCGCPDPGINDKLMPLCPLCAEGGGLPDGFDPNADTPPDGTCGLLVSILSAYDQTGPNAGFGCKNLATVRKHQQQAYEYCGCQTAPPPKDSCKCPPNTYNYNTANYSYLGFIDIPCREAEGEPLSDFCQADGSLANDFVELCCSSSKNIFSATMTVLWASMTLLVLW